MLGPKNRKPVKFKAVLFDFDGTIVDSMKALHTAFNEGVISLGLNPVSSEKLVGMLSSGLSVKQMLLEAFTSKFQGQEDSISECINAIRNSYKIQEKNIRLIPGTVEIMRWLSENGLRIAIVTGSMISEEKMKEKLQSYKLDAFIDTIVTNMNIPRRKPAPDLLLKALKYLGVPAAHSITVGDSIVDIKAGKAAGTWTAAVLTGGEKKSKLKEEEPDFLIESVRDLNPILKPYL